jgi:nicotinate-nucleotide pyrophosphorylase (carboxylating)
MNFLNAHIDALIDLALAEDVGHGDLTTEATVDVDATGRAVVVAKEPLTVSGLGVFARVFARVDARVQCGHRHRDGDVVAVGDEVVELRGPSRAMLTGERTAMNFLMRLSGIATQARKLRELIASYPQVALLDTRKTTPGMRALEKRAVVDGGCANHRFGLFDGILIKENHIVAAGGVANAIARARRRAHHLIKIECEVARIEQLEEAITAGADAVLLDNMSDEQIATAVKMAREEKFPIFVEASGNMTGERLLAVAATGVDAISMGALTHSARSVDMSFLLRP